jgi:hypothetical protein
LRHIPEFVGGSHKRNSARLTDLWVKLSFGNEKFYIVMAENWRQW